MTDTDANNVVPMPPKAQLSQQEPDTEKVDRALFTRIAAGLAVVAALVFGAGGWAATAELSGAVIAPGQIVVDSNVKKIQHPTGGVIGEIKVRTGARVEAGDVLIRLDETQTRASLGIIVSQLTEFTGRKARLAAERDDLDAIAFPGGYLEVGEEAQRVASGEQRLFLARREALASQKGQLDERVGQFEQEIEGLEAQRQSKATELELIEKELDRVDDMYKRKLTPVTRLLAMQREVTRVSGELGALISRIARTKGQISETKLQLITLDQNHRMEAQRELRDLEARIAELAERRIAAEDQLKRVDIRSPLSGTVHELAVHTIGGVINASEQLMLVVPSGDLLTIEIRIAPPDIDQVTVGQKAMLRFPAFNQRLTPELPGRVVRISADLSRDSMTGANYYSARLSLDEESEQQLEGQKLLPGMPVESFIQTEKRTALSYLVKPFTDQFARAFREE